MRAYQVVEFGPPSALKLNEVADLVPGGGQIVVDVAAAGVNFPDTLVVSGRYQILPERPFVPGKELAGTVRAVGTGVQDFKPGDRVLSQLNTARLPSSDRRPGQHVPFARRAGICRGHRAGAGLPDGLFRVA